MPTSTPKTKEARIELRLSAKDKEMLENAAELSGSSVSSYLLAHALPAARRDVESIQTLTLSDTDRDLFLKLLEHPPKPSKKLKDAFKEYRKAYGRG